MNVSNQDQVGKEVNILNSTRIKKFKLNRNKIVDFDQYNKNNINTNNDHSYVRNISEDENKNNNKQKDKSNVNSQIIIIESKGSESEKLDLNKFKMLQSIVQSEKLEEIINYRVENYNKDKLLMYIDNLKKIISSKDLKIIKLEKEIFSKDLIIENLCLGKVSNFVLKRSNEIELKSLDFEKVIIQSTILLKIKKNYESLYTNFSESLNEIKKISNENKIKETEILNLKSCLEEKNLQINKNEEIIKILNLENDRLDKEISDLKIDFNKLINDRLFYQQDSVKTLITDIIDSKKDSNNFKIRKLNFLINNRIHCDFNMKFSIVCVISKSKHQIQNLGKNKGEIIKNNKIREYSKYKKSKSLSQIEIKNCNVFGLNNDNVECNLDGKRLVKITLDCLKLSVSNICSLKRLFLSFIILHLRKNMNIFRKSEYKIENDMNINIFDLQYSDLIFLNDSEIYEIIKNIFHYCNSYNSKYENDNEAKLNEYFEKIKQNSNCDKAYKESFLIFFILMKIALLLIFENIISKDELSFIINYQDINDMNSLIDYSKHFNENMINYNFDNMNNIRHTIVIVFYRLNMIFNLMLNKHEIYSLCKYIHTYFEIKLILLIKV